MRLALADAFDLGGMQGIDLAAALVTILFQHAAGQVQGRHEERAERVVAGGLAANVADDATGIGFELAKRLVGALELMGMGVALVRDQRPLADPAIGLAKADAALFGQPHQPLARPVDQLGVGREHHCLGLHRGIDDHAREVLRRHGVSLGRHCQTLLDQHRKLRLAHALAPARQRRAVKHQLMLEKLFAAEELIIRVFHPALAQRFIGQVVSVLEDRQPRHQPRRRQGWAAGTVGVDRPKLAFQEPPVDRTRQLHQRVPHIDDLVQPRTEQIMFAGPAPLAWLHRSFLRPTSTGAGNHDFGFVGIPQTKFARKQPSKYQNPAITNPCPALNQPNPSIAWEFFTDDAFSDAFAADPYPFHETPCETGRAYCAAMWLSRTTSPQSAISLLSKAAAASGVCLSGGYSSIPPSAKSFFTLGSFSAVRKAALILSTIGFGVPRGTNSMYQKSTSSFL